MICIKSKVFKGLGIIITMICLLFISKMILNLEIDWTNITIKGSTWILIVLLAGLGASCLYLVAYGWSALLHYIEPIDVKTSELTFIYIKSNIAKYLPGNVMNLVGRNILAGQLGFKQINITTSTIIEIIIFGCTTMILSIMFSYRRLKYVYNLLQQYVNYKFIIIGIFVLICTILYIIKKKNQYIKKYFTTSFLRLSIELVLLYSIYFIFLGIMLVIILNSILNVYVDFDGSFKIVGFFILSYFIGYITPGSPGGMGVRETLLILLLASVIGSDLATLAAIVHRLITILADIIIYGISCLLIKKPGITVN